MSFAVLNYAPYRNTCLVILHNARVLSPMNIRLRHEVSSIGRIIRSNKGLDLILRYANNVLEIKLAKTNFPIDKSVPIAASVAISTFKSVQTKFAMVSIIYSKNIL